MYNKITKEQLFVFLALLSAVILFNYFDFGYTGLVTSDEDLEFNFLEDFRNAGITGRVVDCSGIIYDPETEDETDRVQKRQDCENLGDATECTWDGVSNTCREAGSFGSSPIETDVGLGSCNFDGICISDLSRCTQGDPDCRCNLQSDLSASPSLSTTLCESREACEGFYIDTGQTSDVAHSYDPDSGRVYSVTEDCSECGPSFLCTQSICESLGPQCEYLSSNKACITKSSDSISAISGNNARVILSSDSSGVCCYGTSACVSTGTAPIEPESVLDCSQFSYSRAVCLTYDPDCISERATITRTVNGVEEPVIDPNTNAQLVRDTCIEGPGSSNVLEETDIVRCSIYNDNRQMCLDADACGEWLSVTVVDGQGNVLTDTSGAILTSGICSRKREEIPYVAPPSDLQASLAGNLATLTWKDSLNQVTSAVVNNQLTGNAVGDSFFDKIKNFFKDLFGIGAKGGVIRGKGELTVYYYIERSTDGFVSDSQALTTKSEDEVCGVSSCSYVDDLSGKTGGTYSYRVKAADSNNPNDVLFSGYSPVVSVTYQGVSLSVTGHTPKGTVTNANVDLAVTSSVAATCRYDISNTALDYSDMSGMAGSGTTTHTNSFTGLVNGDYTYYIICSASGSEMTTAYQASFTVNVGSGATCGDGDIEGTEQCEANTDCTDTQTCDASCQCVSSSGPVCGDGDIEGNEQCEVSADCTGTQICDTSCQCVSSSGPQTGAPEITIVKVANDKRMPYKVKGPDVDVKLNTNEDAICRISTTDQGYDAMPDGSCVGSSGGLNTDYTCSLTGLSIEQDYNYHIACEDAAQEKHDATTNTDLVITIDKTPGGFA